MVYKRFAVQVVVRLILILVNLTCLAVIFARTDLFFNQLILLLVLIFQIYDLIRLVTQTNRDLSKFLLAIRHADYSVNFTNHAFANPSFQELNQSFQEVIHSYKEVQAQKESLFQFFKLTIEHVHVGIISLNANNEIVVMNKAAERLLKIPQVALWHHLQAKRAAFTNAIDALLQGGNQLVEVQIVDEPRQFSVAVNHVLLLGKPYRMITFQDIENAIEQKEIEAWHKLIRILTHEIMNSVTPVVSLTETMLMILEEEGRQKELLAITEENIEDIRFSLKTIQRRSEGMLHFLNDYRKLTKMPVPQIEQVKVAQLLDAVSNLMQGEISKNDVQLTIRLADNALTMEADFKLIEQVLINLLTNSLQALEGVQSPVIELSAYTKDTTLVIEVADNGKGIDQDKMNKIFIPFYSTKEEGSGIGLSVSKQIMHLHRGSIKVHSQKKIRTSFQLQFPLR